MKYLYEFTVDKEYEEDKTEEREENGQKVSVVTKEKKRKPVYFCFKKPNREERDEAEIVQAAYLSYCVTRGILTEAMLSKTYGNYGGVMTDDERKYYADLLAQFNEKKADFQIKSLGESVPKEELTQINSDLMSISIKIRQFQSQQNAFFENTAEAKAKNRMIEYLALTLLYFKEDEKQDYKPYFKGASMDDKIKYAETLEEKEDNFYISVRNKITLFSAFYANAGDSLKAEDFAQIDREYNVLA